MTPLQCKGVIFDLDGVITDTARIHALAWEDMFNEFLKKHAEEKQEPFKPFDPKDDYLNYVDGKPRFEGVMSFLESRNIRIPYGTPEDPPEKQTVHSLGNRKNDLFQDILKREGPEVFESSVRFVRELKQRGIGVAVASSSRNCQLVLQLAGIDDLFETRVDGVVSRELNLKGKPEPDIFVTAARNMGFWPGECVVIEDAISGVQAGKNGNFGLTLGIARSTDGQLLRQFGADIVIRDLSEFQYEDLENWFEKSIPEDGWNITYHGFDPGDEKLRETMTTVGNGYLGTRGCFEGERASFSFYPGTYIAGIFNKVPSQVEGRTIYNDDFVNCPNWLLIEFKIGSGEYQSPLSMEVLSYRHRLDMQKGVMERTIVCRDKLGRMTRVKSARLASMADPHLCAIQYELTPLNYAATITIHSSLDGNVKNEGVPRYKQLTSRHLDFVDSGKRGQSIFLHVRTTHSKYDIVMGGMTSFYQDDRKIQVEKEVVRNDAEVGERLVFHAKENSRYRLEKFVSIFTSHDLSGVPGGDLAAAADNVLGTARSFKGVHNAHGKAWKRLWDKADIWITGDRFVQRIARLHIYHLLVTASPHNTEIDAGMPARGLHGEAYRGHIFWDELYILPFFILHFPEVAKALLLYRYRRLDAAREYARENGYEGAMFPWQTADDGSEETQEVHFNPESKTWGPDLSRRQRHVSIAVFYNYWRYVFSTGDQAFLRKYGAELMLEVARFWASISQYDESTGKYHIKGVMGPDEFHEKLPNTDEPGLKDNAYTNVMVVWLLEKALELVQSLPSGTRKKLSDKIGFSPQETEKWKDITRKMNVIVTDEEIISQFDGYMELDELDWDFYRKRYYSIHRMDRILKAEGDSPDHYKVAKQADVLMMFYVLAPERVREIFSRLGFEVEHPFEFLMKNYNYYEPRTSHGSTLSKVVHAVISSYIHVDERPWNWFLDAMKSDIYDTQGGTTQEGIHTGVMAGTLDVIIRCFARVNLLGEVLEINPRLPAHWDSIGFRLRFKGIWYDIAIDKKAVTIQRNGDVSEPVLVKVLGTEVELLSGEEHSVSVSEVEAEQWFHKQLMLAGD